MHARDHRRPALAWVRTSFGRFAFWSLGFHVLCLLLWLSHVVPWHGSEGFFGNPFRVGAATAAPVAALAGLLAVIRQRERSLWIALPIVWGLLVALFLLGEIVSPH